MRLPRLLHLIRTNGVRNINYGSFSPDSYSQTQGRGLDVRSWHNADPIRIDPNPVS